MFDNIVILEMFFLSCSIGALKETEEIFREKEILAK